MNFEYLLVSEADAMVHVVINRPAKRNAISQAVMAELRACFSAYAKQDNLLAATLTGAGNKCFAAGGDLEELDSLRSSADAARIAQQSSAALDAIRHFPVPVYALLNGDAIGGGAELALACDVRLAAHHSRIGYAQASLNITPAWGGGRDLMRVVGDACALHLMASAELLSSDAALSLGLIQARCPIDHAFESFVSDYLKVIAVRRPPVMRALKALVAAHRDQQSPAQMRALEVANLVETWPHADHWDAHDRVRRRLAASARE